MMGINDMFIYNKYISNRVRKGACTQSFVNEVNSDQLHSASQEFKMTVNIPFDNAS